MSRGRQQSKKGSAESLELLLDTVTNTFGGILFLALLVAILLQKTSPSPSADDSNESQVEPLSSTAHAEMDVRVNALRDQITKLQDQLNNLESKIPPSSDSETQELVDRVKAVRSSITGALVDKAQSELDVAKLQKEISEIEDEQKKLEKKKQQVEEENQSTASKLAAEEDESGKLDEGLASLVRTDKKNSLVQNVTMPVIRNTSKTDFPLYVRYQKLFIPFDLSKGDNIINTNDFIAVGDPPIGYPRPDRGIPLVDGNIESAVSSALSGFPPSTHYVPIIIYRDSFDHFQPIKKTVLSLGYRYKVLPKEPGDQTVWRVGQATSQ